jgi:hypothetical protein
LSEHSGPDENAAAARPSPRRQGSSVGDLRRRKGCLSAHSRHYPKPY